jgi:predicted DNA-binding transcriptional regulator AlpA
MPVTVKRHVTRAQARKVASRLGVTCTPKELAQLGVWGESKIYDMLREGTFPVEPIKIGNRWRLPTAAVLKYLGLED